MSLHKKSLFVLVGLFFACIFKLDAYRNEYEHVFKRPEEYDRKRYLSYKLRPIFDAHSVDIDDLAYRTKNFSWKDMDDTAEILHSQSKVDGNHIDKALETIAYKYKSSGIDGKRATAYHELGHALGIIYLNLPCRLEKITIKSCNDAEGSTVSLCASMTSEDHYKNKIKQLLAGGVAEQVLSAKKGTGFLDLLSRPGVQDDVKAALNVAYKLMLLKATPEQSAMLADPRFHGIDVEEEKFNAVASLYPDTVDFIKSQQFNLIKVADELVERETLSGKQVHQLVNHPMLRK